MFFSVCTDQTEQLLLSHQFGEVKRKLLIIHAQPTDAIDKFTKEIELQLNIIFLVNFQNECN